MIQVLKQKIVCDRCGSELIFDGETEIDWPFLMSIGNISVKEYKNPKGWIEILGNNYCPKCKREVIKILEELRLIEEERVIK